MAFQLSKVLKSDYVSEYAAITGLSIYFISKKSMITMSFYKEEDSYINGKDPVINEVFELNGAEFPFDITVLKGASPLDLSYAALVLKPEFSGAVIIPDVVPNPK